MKATPSKKSLGDAVLILHDIRSTHNVGSIFRTADGVGISKIFCTGYTPAPVDRFGIAQKEISKTALGAEKTIPWESKKSAILLIERLKKEGYQIIAIEQDHRSISYLKVRAAHKVAFVLGNEVGGIPKAVLSRADIIAEIPLHGAKESLNVSVAAGVALFRMLGR